MKTCDFLLVGGGIVGVSTAWQLKQRFPDATIRLLEKESQLARHQTGRNSGVIHAGVYYQPGSLKADFCRRGAALTIAFCQEHGLPFEQCGKLLVATDEVELGRMQALEDRCALNRIRTLPISRAELKRLEPAVQGLGALLVPATGITDYPAITRTMATLFQDLGGRIDVGRAVHDIRETRDGVEVRSGGERFLAGHLIACGGLMSDRLARMSGLDIDVAIIPFRGEYYRLPARMNRIVSRLIYPIPDPDLPFLGVHLTRMIDGVVTVGPNAVLGWKREGYGALNVSIRDTAGTLAFPGFWKVMQAHLASGIEEMKDSLLRSGYLRRVQRYCPEIRIRDFLPYPAGIRAQAVRKDGTLVHDFLFAGSRRTFHVLNAPSPAATSAMPIGEYLCDRAADAFGL